MKGKSESDIRFINRINEEGIEAYFKSMRKIEDDADVVLAAINKMEYRPSDICVLSKASDEIRGNRKVVLEALHKNPKEMKYVSDELRGDKDFVIEAMNQYNGVTTGREYIFTNASEDIRNDKEVIALFLQKGSVKSSTVMENQLANVQQDDEFMAKVSAKRGELLQYGSNEIRGNKEVVLNAVKSSSRAIQYANEGLRKDKEFLLEVVKVNPIASKFFDEEIRQDDDFMMKAIEVNPQALRGASEKLKNDRSVVAGAVKRKAIAITEASLELQEDREFMLAMAKEKGNILRFANENLQKDTEFVMTAERSMLELEKAKHSAKSIAQGIKPRMGEIKEVENEMVAEKTNKEIDIDSVEIE